MRAELKEQADNNSAMNRKLQIVSLKQSKASELKNLEKEIGITISEDDISEAMTETK